MNTALSETTLAAMSCSDLAELANDAARQCEIRAESTAQAALLAGSALDAAKAQLPHGQWESWLAVNWKFSQSLARRYMQIAKRYRGSVLEQASIRSLLADMSSGSDDGERATEQHQPESYEAPIEVTAREPGKPEKSVGVKVKKPQKPTVKSFVLEDRLDEDRSAILDLAGEYADHEVLPDFLKMAKATLKQIEQEAAQ